MCQPKYDKNIFPSSKRNLSTTYWISSFGEISSQMKAEKGEKNQGFDKSPIGGLLTIFP